MKKILSIFLCVFVISSLLCLCGCEEETLKPTQKFFINDFADVVDEADEETIYNKGAELAEKTKAQVVVVTVETTNGDEISDYALNLGREWGVGDKEKNNGVVILLASEDRQVYISVGYGLEGALPDSKTGRILDNYGTPYFKNDNFSVGLVSVYNAVLDEIYVEYGFEPSESYVPADDLPEAVEEGSSATTVIVSWLILLVIIILYSLFFRRRGIILLPFGFGSGNGNNHFGGFGSGGGFGGFSGGGGSFGGGGAGRGF